MVDVGLAPGGTHAQFLAVTPSGSVFTGDGDIPGVPFHALVWPGQGPLLDLGGLSAPSGVLSTRGQAISADGHTIVGSAYESGGSPYPYAVIWSSSLGMRDLQIYLSSLGLNLNGWTLRSATGISAAGFTIAGWGR